MSARETSFRLLGNLVLVILAVFGMSLTEKAPAAPAPKTKIYALLYIPKKATLNETIRNRRSQIASLKSRSTLYEAIRSLKGVELPLLPKKGKGEGIEDDHDADVAWLEQHLQIEYFDGTGVLRIALIAGTPREQALLVNAVVDGYFKVAVHPQQKRSERLLDWLQKHLNAYRQTLAAAEGEDKQLLERAIVEDQENIKKRREELRTLPRLLELAEVPPK